MPGWVDNLNGPVGIIIGAGKGVIRTMLCNPEYNAEVVPVDLAINGLIAIAWKTGTTDSKNRYVFNSSSSSKKNILSAKTSLRYLGSTKTRVLIQLFPKFLQI